MSICKFCGKEMAGASSCIESYIVIEGEKYAPIPYKKRTDLMFGKRLTRCPDCNVMPGGFHHVGCTMEICPKCQYHWVFCRCAGIKVRHSRNSAEKCKVIPFRVRTYR